VITGRSERPLVLVHGLSGSGRWWRGVRAPLARHADVHVLDVPHIHPRDVPVWLVDWLDDHGLEEVDLVGHSLGGLTCARVAAVAPERVGKLVLVAPAGLPSGRNVVGHLAPLAATVAELPTMAPRLAIDAVRTGPGILRAALYAVTHDLRDELAHIRAPTLLVWGRHDRLVPGHLAEEWLDELADAKLVRVESGHVPMWDAPAALVDAVLHFLQEPPDQVGDEPGPRVVDGVRPAGDDDEPAPA
jgi:pimeloyl-ACP methyl ester carboxylesterase